MRLSLFSLLSGRPASRELQKSNLVSRKETASMLAASVERKGQVLPNLRDWQKRIRHRCLVCTFIESVSSIKTPRFLADLENGMLWPHTQCHRSRTKGGLTYLRLGTNGNKTRFMSADISVMSLRIMERYSGEKIPVAYQGHAHWIHTINNN